MLGLDVGRWTLHRVRFQTWVTLTARAEVEHQHGMRALRPWSLRQEPDLASRGPYRVQGGYGPALLPAPRARSPPPRPRLSVIGLLLDILMIVEGAPRPSATNTVPIYHNDEESTKKIIPIENHISNTHQELAVAGPTVHRCRLVV